MFKAVEWQSLWAWWKWLSMDEMQPTADLRQYTHTSNNKI